MSERILRWESAQRYFAARVRQDLLGDWVVSCAWGGLGRSEGNMQQIPMHSMEAANAAVAMVGQKRERGSYRLVVDRTT